MKPHCMLRIPTRLLFLIFGPLPLGTGWAMWFTRTYALVPRGVAFVTVGTVGFGCTVLLIAWLWSIGRTMNTAMHPSMRWRTVWVDLAVGYTIAYLLLVFVTFPWSESEGPGLPLPILFRLHLEAMATTVMRSAWRCRKRSD